MNSPSDGPDLGATSLSARADWATRRAAKLRSTIKRLLTPCGRCQRGRALRR
jgi:hypothetical protein